MPSDEINYKRFTIALLQGNKNKPHILSYNLTPQPPYDLFNKDAITSKVPILKKKFMDKLNFVFTAASLAR